MTDTATLDAARPTSQPRNAHGDFIWYELLTNDPDSAAAFYGRVIGWKVRDSAMPDMDYRLVSAGEAEGGALSGKGDVAGMMKLTPDMQAGGARPLWLGYVGVDDVDAAVEKARAAGATVHIPPTDIPNVGRFAMLADPQGAVFYVMRGSGDERSDAFVATMKPGHACWNELSTSDQDAAIDFYSRQFGWTKGDALPMGEMGDYRFLHHGEPMIGAVMKQPTAELPPMWVYYFYVPDIDRAAEAVKSGGGAVHYGPVEIPGGDFSITAGDPEGAIFGLVGPRKS